VVRVELRDGGDVGTFAIARLSAEACRGVGRPPAALEQAMAQVESVASTSSNVRIDAPNSNE
jgi:hypothetical protein